MFSRFKITTAVFLALCLSGCSGGGPVVGKWSGKSAVDDTGFTAMAMDLAGDPFSGPTSLVLNGDGTGFMKVAHTPEQPIAWKQEGDKVIFEGRSIQGKTNNAGEGQKASSFNSCVGTLSNNGQSMKIDMGKVQATLQKQKSG